VSSHYSEIHTAVSVDTQSPALNNEHFFATQHVANIYVLIFMRYQVQII